jgi:uncharacterized membrane protein
MCSILRAAGVAVATLAPACSVIAQSGSFTGVGFLGVQRESYAWGVSADGLTVVGESSSIMSGLQTEAYKWTRPAGAVALSALEPSNFLSVANAVSASGEVVVGFSRHSMAGTLFEAFRDVNSAITSGDGIGDLPGGALLSNALAVSSSGGVVVGFGTTTDATGVNRQQAFVFDTSAPPMRALGFLPGDNSSTAQGVSADGTKVAGQSSLTLDTRAVLWTVGPGGITTTPLADLPGGAAFSEAWGISGDGLVVVGDSESGLGNEACKWIGNSVIPLGDLPGGDFGSSANDASADGSIIVGFGSSSTSGFQGEAVYWDANGIHSIKDTLVASGLLSLQGWTLQVANAVSANGRTIVGNGIDPEGRPQGWVARLPGPCQGDFNNDGFRDPDDLADFIVCFFVDIQFPGFCPASDLNEDGFRDPDDLADFIASFFTSSC